MQNGVSDKTLLPLVTRMLEHIMDNGASCDTMINLLSLFCLMSIVTRNQSQGQAEPVMSNNFSAAPPANPLQKLLGDLTKGDGAGPSPDMLMSLLPLLNSPQLKSKLNPSNMAAILGLINTFNGGTAEKNPGKPEKNDAHAQTNDAGHHGAAANANQTNAASAMESATAGSEEQQNSEERVVGRSLNWKSTF